MDTWGAPSGVRSTTASRSAAAQRAVVSSGCSRLMASGNAFQVTGRSPLVAGDEDSEKNNWLVAGRSAISFRKLSSIMVCQASRKPCRVGRSSRSSMRAGGSYLNMIVRSFGWKAIRRSGLGLLAHRRTCPASFHLGESAFRDAGPSLLRDPRLVPRRGLEVADQRIQAVLDCVGEDGAELGRRVGIARQVLGRGLLARRRNARLNPDQLVP